MEVIASDPIDPAHTATSHGKVERWPSLAGAASGALGAAQLSWVVEIDSHRGEGTPNGLSSGTGPKAHILVELEEENPSSEFSLSGR